MNRVSHRGLQVRQGPQNTDQDAEDSSTETETETETEDESSGGGISPGPAEPSSASPPPDSPPSTSSTASSFSPSSGSSSNEASTSSFVSSPAEPTTSDSIPTGAGPAPTAPSSSAASTGTSVSSSVGSSSSSTRSVSPSPTGKSTSATFTTTSTATPVPSSTAGAATSTASLPAGVGTGTDSRMPAGTPAEPNPGTSETAAPAATGATHTGAVAGGIFGGLVVIMLLIAAITYYLRRRRSKRATHHFDAASFRRSAMVIDDERVPTPEIFPSHPAHQSVNSSINGPGMAGHGAYAYREAQEQQQPYYPYQYTNQQKSSAEFYTDTFAQQFDDEQQMQQVPTAGPSSAVLAQKSLIQPKQSYTFGQAFDAMDTRNVISDDGHDDLADVYSSQPMHQVVYDTEAYASYAHSPDMDQSGRVCSDATRQRIISNANEGTHSHGGI